MPEEIRNKRAGCFVSIKKNGDLRGCIGTISPTRNNIEEQIINMAIEAGTRDPRFEAVTLDELSDLIYDVDVLYEAEPATKEQLDVKRYGVIVSSFGRRGLLLPNLEGVDDVDYQLRIACAKAGIAYGEDYSIERFEVERHE